MEMPASSFGPLPAGGFSSASDLTLVAWLVAGALLASVAVLWRRARRVEGTVQELHRHIVALKHEGETLSRMAAIVQSSDDAIIGKTLDGIITSWNPAAEGMYGYSAEEALGRPVSFLVPPERPDELMHILEKIRHGDRVDHYETVRVGKAGRRIHVSLTVSPIRDATGEITGASTIARDITERKRSEEALRESEERYRDLVEQSEDLIFSHDRDGKLLSANRALVRFLGYDRAEDLLGRTLRDFLASDVVDMFDAYLETVLKDGYVQGLMKIVTMNGEERILEYRNSLRRLPTPTVRCIAHDVTERVRAEQALTQRTERLHRLRDVTLEISREIDITRLLEGIIHGAAGLLGALSGAIYLWDERAHVLSVPALYSLGEWTRGKHLRLGEEIAGTVAQRREGMIVNEYASSPYASSFFLERAAFTAVIAEPLLCHNRLVGVLTVNNEGTGQRFTEEDQDFLRLLAVEAAIAIENAQLYSVLADSKRRLGELYGLGVAMQEPLTFSARLDLILKGAQTVLGFDRMNILLADSQGTRLSAVASLGVEEPLEQISVPIGPEGGGLAKAFLERIDIVWEGFGPVPTALRLAPPSSEIRAFRSRCFVIVPLIVRGTAIGVLGADNKHSQRPIPTETVHLLKTFAAQAAIAIENARLYEEVTRYAKRLEQHLKERGPFPSDLRRPFV
jgi:PAS domain S-box-containing protein